jgi:SSS family solute:Na+ symporter
MTRLLVIFLVIFTTAYLAAMIVVLKRQGRGDQSLLDFFVSGRSLGLGTAIATLGATEIGLITVAYNAQKGFNEGFAAFHIGLAALVGCLIIGLTGFVVKPLRATGVLTLPEFYEQRYGRDVRVFGAVVMALGGILNMGLFLKVAALVIASLLHIGEGAAMANIIMIALIAISVAYTCYGGMRSVIATDLFQFVVLSAGLIVVVVFLHGVIPFDQAVAAVQAKKGTGGLNPFVNASFGFTYVMWMVLVAGIVSAAIWPTALTRALCIENPENVPRAYLMASLIFLSRMVIPAFLGAFAFVYFNTADLAGGEAVKTLLGPYGADGDLVAMPVMLRQLLPPWLLAFMAVAMIATFMSTQDSYLFCWASIISRDILGPLTGRIDDARFQFAATRTGIVVIALYELYWGLIYKGTEDVWDYLTVSGSIYFCSGIVLLAGGLYWKRATRRGALCALILGFSAALSLGPLKTAAGLDGFTNPQIGFAAIVLSILGFVIGSLTDKPSATAGAAARGRA